MVINGRPLTSLAYGILPCAADFYRPTGPAFAAAKLKAQYRLAGRPAEIRSVMIVDDNLLLTGKMTWHIAHKLRASVLVLNTASPVPIKEQTIKIVRENNPDMIFMDGNLGRKANGEKENGSEIIKELRALGYTGYIIANSTDSILNWDMRENGADFSARIKFSAKDKIYKLCAFLNKYFQGAVK